MRLTWLPNGWKDYLYWQDTDRRILQRVNELIRDALRNPFSGIGKAEPLKNNLKGWWSRRITQEHSASNALELCIMRDVRWDN